MDKEQEKYLRDVLDMSECPSETPVTIYDRDGTPVVTVNTQLEWMYARLQIKRNQIEGCYIIHNEGRYEFNRDGKFYEYPRGVMETCTDVTSKLVFGDKVVERYKPKSKLININNCPHNEHVDIYDNEDNLICHTNDDLQFNWVRARIREQKLKGCYLIFHRERIEISEYGDPLNNPNGLFDNNLQALFDMVK